MTEHEEQMTIAYKERLVVQERLNMLTHIFEGHQLFAVSFQWDDDRQGSPVLFREWHRQSSEANAYYRHNLQIMMLETTPTIDAETKVITRHPVDNIGKN